MNTTNTRHDHEKKYEAKETTPNTNTDGKTKKNFWKKYTDRLKNTRCTRTSQDCE